MCGIFGVVNGKKSRSINLAICNALMDATIAGTVRGADSTGVLQYGKKGAFIHKRAVNGVEFSKDDVTNAFYRDADSNFFTLFHNRSATVGTITDENAHPFEYFDEKTDAWGIGVHNGTLNNWKVRPGGDQYDVDSEWAISRLIDKGKEAFRDFFGAYCFVWYDAARPNVLNFARNVERPMYLMYVKDQDRMLFASEWEMMTWIASRRRLELEDVVVSLEPGYHYEVSLDNPREFLKTKIEFNSSTASWADQYVERIAYLLDGKGQKKGAKSTGKRKVSDAIVVPAAPEVPWTVDGAKAIPYVSPEEVRIAKFLDLVKKEVVIETDAYLSDKQELWGSVVFENMIYPAVIRRVNKATYDVWKASRSLGTSIVGAYMDKTDGIAEPILVLTRAGVGLLPNKDEEERSSIIETAMRKALEQWEGINNDTTTQQ